MKDKQVILVVDDQPQNVELLEAYLVPQGYEIVKAANGEEALGKIFDNQIDVVLMDAMMPGMNGFDVTIRMKSLEDTRDIPIVMITGLNDVLDRVKALEAGASDFLTKPVDRAELLATVRAQMEVKSYRDHLKKYRKELEATVAQRTAELHQAFDRLKQASLNTILRLTRASEYRDEDTGAHITRMSNFSAIIARWMGLSTQVVETILYAAPMHDVGKIGIPDNILLKPGPLDEQEWQVMKMHTVYGGRILEGEGTGFIKLGEVIAMTHHEKWDGSGYPKGLKGRKIPLVGRVVAMADVFDALTSKRPYKEAFPLDKSLAIIREGRGTHFDPAVVDAFFKSLDEILAVKEKHRDNGESLLYKLSRQGGQLSNVLA